MFYIKHGLDQFIVQHEEKLLNRTDKTNNFYLSRKCYFNAKSLTKEKNGCLARATRTNILLG
jgi:hypothetical protein